MKFLLKIDPEFRSLTSPISQEERAELVESILHEGCINPIVVWNGTILDGHNRYEICMENDVDFQLKSLDLQNREEAIIWICRNQMDRRNLSEERRKYLIGKQYESEKFIGAMNRQGINQYSEVRPTLLGEPLVTRNKTAMRLAERYHISHATVQKYEHYSRAVDQIKQVDEDLVERMLSGETRISHENMVILAGMADSEIQRVAGMVREKKKCTVRIDFLTDAADSIPKPVIDCMAYGERAKRETGQDDSSGDTDIDQNINQRDSEDLMQEQERVRSVKDDPLPDPDSDVSGLSFTIPSWCYSIDRVRRTREFPNGISNEARRRFRIELMKLKKTINRCLSELRKGDIR